ncbi:MAG: hypothetical protein GY906_37755, partial [bacterium]|nr:hypothetical protein [bacterium]
MRQADTSGATQVTLNFDYIRRFLTSATEYATAEVCEDWNGLICATGWIVVGLFQGPGTDAAYQPFSLDLNTVPGLNPISSTFALRFTSNNLVPPRPPISVNIDNVQLVLTGSGGGTVTNPSNDPPFFVEVADDYDLAPGEQLTLTYDVLVDDPLAVNLFDVTNTAEVRSTSLLIPSIDSVTDDVPITVVGDTVWYDLDDDGVVDVGEPGIPNVQVNLLDSGGAVVATTTTASNGTYRFDLNGLPAGDYEVEAVNPPAGLVPSTIATNPTGLFTVAEGDTYLDADIGFRPAPGTAIIGNQVWSDANFDGFRDPGEIGIGGVTIELRRQSDGALIATATTAPDGSYLFTGLAADDYYVDVLDHDPGTGGSGPLNGYALVIGGQSNVDPTLPITVVAGDVYLYADFGFYNALLHTVGDTVWYDADGDAFRDDPVSEPGIEGVSVDLLDSLGNVIGTTFTAADGTFTFDGVPDGTYEYRIPHGTGILTGYTPTTPDAIASGRTIVVAGADVIDIDDFGYTLYGAIGDTVFSDANANRVQDPGEVGIGGVTVELFRDQNANGILDIGDGAAIETTTTDSSGRYLFTRRPAAVYFVSVNDGQAALTGYIPTTIDEEAWPGTQLVAVLPTGTSSFLEADFGYQDPTLLDISGTVWHDEHDPPGSIDPGEVGISTVTIELLDPNGVMVASTTTDASGNYLFPNVANLPVGQQYTVQVTDIFGVLIGMVSTTGGDNQPADPGDTNINFGYRRPGKVTLASISEFRVISDGTTSVVEWITRTELGTMGFLLERYDSTSNEWRRVNNKLVPALIASPQGGVYRHPDGEVTLGATHTYRLVEEEIWGSTRVHGPFEVEVAPSAGETLSNLFEAQAHQPEPHRYVMRYAMDSPPGTRAKIIVREAGLTHLDAATIADALEDVDEAGVVEWIAQGQLRLSHREQEVAWKADADGRGVSFIAEAIDSLYTLDNVYWAEPGQGTVMEEVLNSLVFTDDFENGSVNAWSSGKGESAGSGRKVAAGDSLSFSDCIKYEEDAFPATLVSTDPESDYWYWKGMIGGHPTLGTVSVSIEVPAPVAGDSNGQLVVRMYGINDTAEVNDHRVAVWINGEYAGKGVGQGTGAFPVNVDIPSPLNDGTNEIQLVAHLDHAGPSYLYMDSLELAYRRGHRAADDVLEIGIEESGLVTVDGFTSDEITVINTSDPE